jgi:hypothetical protein
MRILSVIAALLVFHAQIFPQKTANGFIVTLKNDTVDVHIVLSAGVGSHKAATDLSEGVEIIEADSSRVLSPSQIMRFGIFYENKWYVRVSKPISQYRSLFLVPEYEGNLASLYSIPILKGKIDKYPVGDAAPIILLPFTTRSTTIHYTIEKANSEKLYLNGRLSVVELRKMLESFFSDCPEVLRLIDKKIVASRHPIDVRNSIREIVVKYDALKNEELNNSDRK